MAKLVFGMNQSLDGYVDHLAFEPGPTLYRHFIEEAQAQAGSIYGRVMYEVMRYFDDEHPEWKPWLKSNGMAVPGFRAGWFRTRGFQRVFACITDGERVLWIPTARKHALLLQAGRPQDLLARLRALAPPAARG